MSSKFVKGYGSDAALDIIMQEDGAILPGFSRIKLPVKYEPAEGEVAMISARTSTLNAGIFLPVGLIDPGYKGYISAWVFNCSGTIYHYKAGDRLFSVVNLQLGKDRVAFTTLNEGSRDLRNLGSSGGHS